MEQATEHFGGGAFLHHAGEEEHRDPVAEAADHGEVVADEEEREAKPGPEIREHA